MCVRMVERDACSTESKATLNGVSSDDREERISAVVARERPTNVVRVAVGEPQPFGNGNARFSLFRWFKRARNRDSTVEKRRKTSGKFSSEDNGRRRSVCSSAESVDTFYSTTTVRSFAFHTGSLGRYNGLSLDVLKQAAEVGPFAAGASKAVIGNKENIADVAYTLPTNVHSRSRNITARYSLQPSTTFSSCGNLPDRRLPQSLKKFDEHTRATCNGSARKRAHVKGKRRAPDPPRLVAKAAEVDAHDTQKNGSRRKRRAPKPPDKVVPTDEDRTDREEPAVKVTDGGMERGQVISNDTLVLQGGVLLSKKEVRTTSKVAKDFGSVAGSNVGNSQDPVTPSSTVGTLNAAMPRPWYKRSVFEHSRDSATSRRGDVLRSPASSTIEVKEECVGSSAASSAGYAVDASLSRLSFFHRGERQMEDRKRETKRRSGLSILTNISELDKEAAAIVQEEQARSRASMLLKTSRFVDSLESRNDVSEEIVQNMVASAIEDSPRRGTRALISKFNAISNITKVTVNTNFFARNAKEHHGCKFEHDIVRHARSDHVNDKFTVPQSNSQNVRIEKDISRYFLPHQRASRNKDETTNIEANVPNTKITPAKEQNDHLVTETSSRISFLQSQLAGNRINDPVTSATSAAMPVMEEKIRLRQEVAGKRNQKATKTDYEGPARYLFSQANTSNERAENMLGVSKESKQGSEGLEAVHKEFSDIFDEIDRQLRSKEFKLIDRHAAHSKAEVTKTADKLQEDKAGISSKVTKVLDILVEMEKDEKSKVANVQTEKSTFLEGPSTSAASDSKLKTNKMKSPVLNRVDDPVTTDLKEMLKEMKHSLPKRPKPTKATSKNSEDSVKLNAENKVSYFAKPIAKTEPTAQQNEYEVDKQKVSSSAQTSGNVRRLNQASTSSAKPSTSGWKQEDVLYRTSGKSVAGAALVKNTFQLIRPRDFAEIEATKTVKGPYKENTYANVIEQSLYANAQVPSPSPKKSAERTKDIAEKESPRKETVSPSTTRKTEMNDEDPTGTEEGESTNDKNMNTLDINRLLRKLEAAIASGHHQQAAGLAKELARLKIHCSVVRQRSARLKDHLIKVNMYIEDKLAHQGPIPLQLQTRMTVAELKTKVHTEFEIPTNVQRWIIGKNLADRDEATLEELHAADGSPIFLYLVAPELHNENVIQTEAAGSVEETFEASDKEPQPTPRTNVLQIIEEQQESLQNEQNSDAEEHIVTKDDQPIDDQPKAIDNKMERYEELISLENCDVIPNSEPMECPVCFVTYGPLEGVILRDCLHMFCRPCLANTIRYCEEAEVKCPYRDTEYTCESTLQEREIKALVEAEVYQQHLAKSIVQAENNAGNNAFHCKTPDCPGWCIYDDDVNNFLCPVCGANNCLTCQVVHTGRNCKQYQQELRFSKETDQESKRTAAMLEEMVDRGEALACPTCAVVLMKKWGCDWLRCSMCKTEICWVTRGPRWGPGGKGDTSGGCKCGENGVKCHPRCNYCH